MKEGMWESKKVRKWESKKVGKLSGWKVMFHLSHLQTFYPLPEVDPENRTSG